MTALEEVGGQRLAARQMFDRSPDRGAQVHATMVGRRGGMLRRIR